jgi:ubiquinone/menaquinone biosynthesis C-methylase UbiE
VAAPDPEPDLVRFYTTRYVEDDRLRASPHGRLELARTRELLRRRLPPAPARVLDVGGGTGVHARWLVEDGYEVHLVDLVPEHAAQAASIDGITTSVGDARRLEQPGGSVDAVLLLGPLYHLVARRDRLSALAEARRVAHPGGLVAAAAISRYAGLLDLAALGQLDEHTEPLLRRVIRTGRHEPRLGFTTAYLHLPDELAGELHGTGLRDVEVLGVEGPTGPALDAHGLDRLEDLLPAAVRCARMVERDPALIAASAHLLAFGRA